MAFSQFQSAPLREGRLGGRAQISGSVIGFQSAPLREGRLWGGGWPPR